jgi:hypothetical protein
MTEDSPRFRVDKDSPRLPADKNELFHTITAKVLYPAYKTRPDLLAVEIAGTICYLPTEDMAADVLTKGVEGPTLQRLLPKFMNPI